MARAQTGRGQAALTDVMLLEQLIQAGQVLDNEVAQDPLVCLDAQQGGAEVGGREQVLDDGAHHPEGVLLLQEQQEAGGHLARAGGQGALTQVSTRMRSSTLLRVTSWTACLPQDRTTVFGSYSPPWVLPAPPLLLVLLPWIGP